MSGAQTPLIEPQYLPEEKIQFLISFLKEMTGLDFKYEDKKIVTSYVKSDGDKEEFFPIDSVCKINELNGAKLIKVKLDSKKIPFQTEFMKSQDKNSNEFRYCVVKCDIAKIENCGSKEKKEIQDAADKVKKEAEIFAKESKKQLGI